MTDLSLTIASNNLTTSCLSIVDFEYHFQFLLLAQHHPMAKHLHLHFEVYKVLQNENCTVCCTPIPLVWLILQGVYL